MDYPKVLIITSEPYKQNSSSRYLESLFGMWEHDKIALVYTVATKPVKCFCENYYRITDKEMLKSMFNRKFAPGKRIAADENADAAVVSKPKKNDGHIIKKIKDHKYGPVVLTIRDVLWHNKKWDNASFWTWIDEFGPEIVFFDMKAGKRVNDIALTVVKRKNIPCFVFFPDDYYFKYKNSNSGISKMYAKSREKYITDIFEHSKYNFFCCDVMKAMYMKCFGCSGEALYFVSNIKEEFETKRIPKSFLYCGAIEYDRWKTLIKLGKALNNISPDYNIDVYTSITNNQLKEKLDEAAGLKINDPIPYSEVKNKMQTYEYVIHVEDFSENSKKSTRYSLSTKIADCLSCGACTIAVGPEDIGSIDYLKSTNGAFVCTDIDELENELKEFLNDKERQKEYIENAKIAAQENHSAEKTQNKILELCRGICSEWEKNK